MLNKHILRATLVGALLATTAPAYAELTPQIALDRYFAVNEAAGLNMIVGDKSSNGDTVRWSDIKISDDKGTAVTTIPWVEATQSGNDTVLITTSPTAQSTISGEDEDQTTTLNMELNNVSTYVTEDGDLLSFAFSGDSINVSTQASATTAPFSMNVSLSDLSGAYAMSGEERIDGTMATGPITVVYGIDDEDTIVASNTTIASMEAAFGADIVGPEQMEGYLTGDHSFKIDYSFGESLTDVTFSGPEGEGTITSGVAETTASISVIDAEFKAKGEAIDVTYKILAPQLGLPPVDAKIADIDMDVNVKFGKSGDVTPMGMSFGLNGIEINEALWGMFDPQGEIPREPATIQLDLEADSLWLADKFEDAIKNEQPPFMPQTVELTNLFVSLGGASLTASGAGEMSMATGRPSGKATVELRGLLSLVQKLASIGVIPPQQAMMAAAMAPQFTRPGPEGPEHLISDIEANSDGSITINGNRIK